MFRRDTYEKKYDYVCKICKMRLFFESYCTSCWAECRNCELFFEKSDLDKESHCYECAMWAKEIERLEMENAIPDVKEPEC